MTDSRRRQCRKRNVSNSARSLTSRRDAGYWLPSLNLVVSCKTPHSVSGSLFQRYPCGLGAVSHQAFALPFAMPAWLAFFCVQLCLFAAAQQANNFNVEGQQNGGPTPNAGPTSGGKVIAVTYLDAWNANWTPVITLQGMQIAASDWVVNNTEGRIRIKVPPGPGCVDQFLTVWSDCTASNAQCGGSSHRNLVLRLNTTLNYEPPSISLVEPTLAQFVNDDNARSMTIHGTNFGKSCPDKPTVQVSS